MAAKAKLSILGLYQWNNHIFDDMEIPEEIDAETVKWEILEECAELEILYPDPDFMKESIKFWSRRMLPNWQKIVDALIAEYNPIWNKDGTIRETMIYGEHSMQYGQDKVTAITGQRDQTNTHSVSGFNEQGMHASDEDHAVGLQATDTNTRDMRTDTSRQHTDTRTVTEQGNIGVTESSAMVRHEVELRAEFNIYQIIVDDFKKKYCLMVY